LIGQLRSGGTQRGAGIGMIFAVLLLVIASRQTLLDLFPRPGHAYVGSAVFGIHMPVWSVLVAVALLLGFALRLALFDAPHAGILRERPAIGRLIQAFAIYVAVICVINFLSVVVQCGTGECHTTGYRLLQ
jgi:hypothetical protein